MPQETVGEILTVVAPAVTTVSVQAPRTTPSGGDIDKLHGLHVTVAAFVDGVTLRAHGVSDVDHALRSYRFEGDFGDDVDLPGGRSCR